MAHRKGFRRGSDRHAGTSSSSRSYGPPGSSSRASAPTHSPDRGSHTVGPTEHYQDRIQNIAAQNQRTSDLRNRASNQGFHQFLTPRDQVAKKTLGMRLSGLGGLFGALGRGALSFFGGIPGKALSGIMTAQNWAKRKGTDAWGGVKDFGAGVKEFSEHDNLMSYLNRNKVQALQPIETMDIREKFDRTGNVMQDNLTTNMGANNQMVDPNFLALGARDGGRIGYRTAGPVFGHDEPSEPILEFMQDQNIPYSPQVEGGPTEEQISMVIDMDSKGIDMDTISSVTELGKEVILSILGVKLAQGGIARLL